MKRAMRSDSHTGESKINAANDYLGEFHIAIENQFRVYETSMRIESHKGE